MDTKCAPSPAPPGSNIVATAMSKANVVSPGKG